MLEQHDSAQAVRILLVEDEAIIALSEKAMLEQSGYSVDTALTGESAVGSLSGGVEYDLVLMDVNLGTGMDGVAAASRILEEHDLPIVFLSSHSDPKTVNRTESVTSYGYVLKTSPISVLLASIAMALRLARARSRLRHRQDQLAQSERQYRELADSIRTVFFALDAQGTVTYWNAASRRLTGVLPANVVGRRLRTMIPKLGSGKMASAFRLASRSQQTQTLEYPWRSEAGELTFLVSVFPTQDGLSVLMDDITRQKRSERVAEQQSGFRQLLMEIATGYINLPTARTDDAIGASLERMSRFVEADRGYVFAYDHRQGHATNTHEWCGPGVVPQKDGLQQVPLDAFPEALAAHREGRALHWPDVTGMTATGSREFLREQGIRSVILVPMMDGAECTGFVGFDSVQSARSYSADERDLLAFFAQLLVNLQNRRRTEQTLERHARNQETLVHETHHRMKNNIAAVSQMLSLEADQATDPRVRSTLERAKARLRVMSDIYHMLVVQRSHGTLCVAQYLHVLIESIVNLHARGPSISINESLEAFELSATRLVYLGIIVNELVTNAARHAFAGRSTGSLYVGLTKAGDTGRLIVADDGVGQRGGPSDEQGADGFGTFLVQLICEELGGGIETVVDGGTRHTIEFQVTGLTGG